MYVVWFTWFKSQHKLQELSQYRVFAAFGSAGTRCVIQMPLIGCFEDLRRFSDISVKVRLGSRSDKGSLKEAVGSNKVKIR